MKWKLIKLLSVLVLLIMTVSCKKDFFPEGLFSFREDEWIHDQPANQGVVNALNKAALVAGIEWTPILPVPNVYSSYYPEGVMRQGLPYSLAQKVNGYVGLDVSFHTFLTALHNPRSVMYTENLKLPPYNGFDAAPYYGSVCSTSVWYALGVKAPFYTYYINYNHALTKRNDLPPDSIQLCDVLWRSGHVAMVYDIGRDYNDSIKKVVVFETTRASHADSRLIEYDYNGFCTRWYNDGWIIYRPNDLSDNPAPEELDLIKRGGKMRLMTSYNDDLCTSRGDRVAYPAGDSVVINILSNAYSALDLYKDGMLFQSFDIGPAVHQVAPDLREKDVVAHIPVKKDEVVLYDLPYGDYKACLRNSMGCVSDFTYFEVIDINVSYMLGDQLTVYFSSANATPEFMSLGDIRECPYYCTIFTPNQISQGSATVSFSSNYSYLKVHFRGQYGRVSNRIIHVE